ncbi:SpoIIE family protein phosphatase [Streptomyces ficellus]|uniref:protein-serine/threonine phosphatase n=1 Tax=Streptomyces ficellus TaxID=1977088 RepID=A0A6I6FT35_9ACTN|nr:GAF domain-containing protein [Streptomyces ficellus]
MRRTGAAIGMGYLYPPGDDALRLAVLSGVSLEFAAPWMRVGPHDPVPVAHAVAEGRLVWIADREDMARRYPRPGLVLPYPFSLAAAPVAADGTTWGGLVLMWPGGHPPELSAPEEEALHDGRARMAGILARAAADGSPVLPGRTPRLVRPARHTPGPVEAVAAVEFIHRLPGGSCALDLGGRITFVTEEAAALLDADIDTLMGRLPWEALPWMDNPAVEDRYRAAVISRRVTTFTTLRPPDHWLRFELHPDATGISVRVTPAEPEGETPRNGTDTEAEHTTRSALPSRATALYHLMHLAATLTEAAGVRDVADQAADQIVPALGAHALALLTAEEGRLHVVGHRGYAPGVMARFDSAPLSSHTPAARVLASGLPLFFGTRAELENTYPAAIVLDAVGDAWAFLPLIASGRPVGSLILAYDRPRPFHPAERAILTSLAGLIAQALDRARLYDSKRDLAHRLQDGLLPHTLPHVPGLEVAARYLPAGRGMGVGGDFYDLIRLRGSSAAATIGDVQGHDVAAAALMGQVRAAVHAGAGAPPGEVLARANRLLTDLEPGLFTSCLYAHIDLKHHRALLATAGHPPPLVRHPDGRTDVLDLPPGLLLGIDPAADYPTGGVTLPLGTVLVLYTDGLVEAPGISLDDATTDLAALLGATDAPTMDALADVLVAHARGSAPRHDDIALLLLRTVPPV